MSRALQWVIGIGVVLMVAAFLVAMIAPLFLARMGVAGYPMMSRPGPMFMFGPGPMFGVRGVNTPFFWLFGLFGVARLLWPLLIFGLVVWALVTLMRPRPQTPYVASAPMAPAPPTPPAPVSQAVCANCGQPLQPGWRHCPSCGTAIG